MALQGSLQVKKQPIFLPHLINLQSNQVKQVELGAFSFSIKDQIFQNSYIIHTLNLGIQPSTQSKSKLNNCWKTVEKIFVQTVEKLD